MGNFLVTDRAGGNIRLSQADGGELLVQPGVGTGNVTTVTATAPITSTGGAAPNIAATSPSRVYGIGVGQNPIATSPGTPIATATLTPSNTGKLQITAWLNVVNIVEAAHSYAFTITDGLGNTLFTSPFVEVPFNASGWASVTIDSDLNAGGTPHTYALGVPTMLTLTVIAVDASSLAVAAGGSGLLVKENFN
jgi:hypothetical protein